MQTLILSAAILLAATAAQAEQASTIPKSIVAAQRLLVLQGTCEQRWEEFMAEGGATRIDLGRGSKLFIVPCSHWAFNVGWTAYVVTDESTNPDGFITKPVSFVSYIAHEGIFASPVIHNPGFDPTTKSILARYYSNGSPTCGSIARYQWEPGLERFQVKVLAKQDDCKNPEAEWKPVLPELKPGT